MCKVLKASRSGYYQWKQQQEVYTITNEQYLLINIKEVYERSKKTYGSRRITHQLKKDGINCYQNQISRIMKKYNIKSITKRKFVNTTDSNHNYKVVPNILNREFNIKQINIVWVGDITYIWTREGWLYLSTVIDLFSRRIVGWSLSNRMTKALVIQSINNAIDLRHPNPELLFHTDQGSQYASNEFKMVLTKNEIKQSMSRRGNCWDNAVAESFFKTIKIELIYRYDFKTRKEAELIIFEYIEMFYNTNRLHSTINYMSPCDYEKEFVG